MFPRVLSAVCCPSPGFVFQRFMSFIFHRRGPLQLRFSGRQITIFTRCSDGELHAPTLQQDCRATLQTRGTLLQNNLILGQYSSFVLILGPTLFNPIIKIFIFLPAPCCACCYVAGGGGPVRALVRPQDRSPDCPRVSPLQ